MKNYNFKITYLGGEITGTTMATNEKEAKKNALMSIKEQERINGTEFKKVNVEIIK